jgi:hypothetical protein
LCVGVQKKNVMANEIARFGGLNLFSLVCFSELMIQCTKVFTCVYRFCRDFIILIMYN